MTIGSGKSMGKAFNEKIISLESISTLCIEVKNSHSEHHVRGLILGKACFNLISFYSFVVVVVVVAFVIFSFPYWLLSLSFFFWALFTYFYYVCEAVLFIKGNLFTDFSAE